MGANLRKFLMVACRWLIADDGAAAVDVHWFEPRCCRRRNDPVIFFCEGETDSTSEKARGQFSIFGAIEEKDRESFPELGRMKKILNHEQLSCVGVEILARCTVQRCEARTVGSRMSTGCAQEMQKGSGQWPVVRGQSPP
jgi:hypothetical protein